MVDKIIAAIAELRAVARSEHDERRARVADRLDELFADATDVHSLQEAAAEDVGMYSGGTGSFQDVGSPASAHVVDELYVALERGRSWPLRNTGPTHLDLRSLESRPPYLSYDGLRVPER